LDRLLALAEEAKQGIVKSGGQLVAGLHLLGILTDGLARTGPGYERISESEIRIGENFYVELSDFIPKNAWVKHVRRYFASGEKEANWHPRLTELAMEPARYLDDRSPIDDAWRDVDRAHRVNAMIERRLAARAAKNWAESDRLRDELAAMGIALKDGKDADGNPFTTWEVKR
jgi:cysteinyl-tRNA synthetase